MSIRWKLLILLLALALVPLLFITLLDRHAMLSLGQDLGSQARESLTERTGEQLQQLIHSQADRLRREKESLEHTLRGQARAVERCLAGAPKEGGRPYFSNDFDGRENQPPGLQPSTMHYRFPIDRPGVPIAVTYEAQVFKLAPGVARQEVADHIARMLHLTDDYRFGFESQADLIYWQYTALDNGVHSSYPGHGGYPAEYDPRDRAWYRTAKEQDVLSWIGPYFDASSEQLILTLAMPVQGPDGDFAGVTALDVTIADVVDHMKLPPMWSGEARSLMVRLIPRPETGRAEASIVVQPGYHEKGQRWDTGFDTQWLESDNALEMQELLDDLEHRRWGQHQMPYGGRDSLWVYGPLADQDSHLVLILPYDEVVAQAVAAEQGALVRTGEQMRADGIVASIVIVVLVLCALVGSRSVTKPVRELADAATRIAGGDLEARVENDSGDEIGRLGGLFNAMVPQLKDRMKMRQSLALAMEVQQNLLPHGPPQIEGLDVAGDSIYCDETGGDYYDFLDLSELTPGQLGVAIGDVTGHGIAAAMMMTTGRALLRSRANQTGNLAALMNDLNRYLSADMSSGRFMTLFYLVIGANARQVRWASAGHDPAICYDPATDAFTELPGGDLPLGVDGDWQYSEHGPVELAAGQILLLGTDGIWESRSPQGSFFGKDALRELIRRHADRPAKEISQAVTTELAEFRKNRAQEDDVTLVVVKVT
ncbi:MAG: SpoIIE family protein phosphatase [bacterium]|nr:SpoIIE family protein phosphatase [bacterium]